MNWKYNLILATVTLSMAGLFGLVACSEDSSPMAPTETDPTETPAPPIPSLPNTPTTESTTPTITPPTQDGIPAKGRFNPTFHSKQGTFDVIISHIGDAENAGRVGVACYENPYQTRGERQTYHDSNTGSIRDGDSRRVSAAIPKCVYWQCDGFEGTAITGPAGEEIDVFYGRRLIFGRSGPPQGGASCNPPPVCDLENLESKAEEKCEYGFKTDPRACTFTCNPPPSCEELFKVETSVDGNRGWVFLKNTQGQTVGQEHVELTREPQSGEVCVGDGQETLRSQLTDERTCCLPWRLPPRPPSCEEDNPRTIFNGSGTSRVENRTGADGHPAGKRVTARASGSSGGAAFSGEIGILWRRGESKFVKTKAPIANRCGHRSGTVNLSWTSTSGNHTACDANYSLIWYTNGNRSNPNIQHEIPLTKTGICAIS